MSGYRTVVTRKGQVTLPADLRRKLGIEIGDKVEARVEGGNILIHKPSQSIAERTKGMFRHAVPDPPYTREQERAAYEEAMAEGAVAEVAR